jgi:hypothetical protein
MKTPHTATYPGATCRVELKDGTVFVDKFRERTAGKWVIFDHRRVRAGAIKAFSHRRLLQPLSAHAK